MIRLNRSIKKDRVMRRYILRNWDDETTYTRTKIRILAKYKPANLRSLFFRAPGSREKENPVRGG
jgi:hypothetical protein